MPKTRQTKPATTRSDRTLLGAYFPEAIVRTVDAIVKDSDTDRSKFIRAAVREKIARQSNTALAS